MDKNTLVGFLLIIGIFIGFFWISQPSAEQIEVRQRYNDSIMQVKQEQAQLVELEVDEQKAENIMPSVVDSVVDSIDASNVYGPFAAFVQGKDSVLTLENEKLRIGIDTKGGVIKTVELKEFVTHDKKPLLLMDGSADNTNFTFVTSNNRIVNTEDLYFEPIWKNKGTSLTMRLAFDANSYIDFEYSLKEDDYLVSFKIIPRNIEHLLSKRLNVLDMEWNTQIAQQELGRKFENRYAA